MDTTRLPISRSSQFGGLPIGIVLFLMLVSAVAAGGSVWYWQTHLPTAPSADTTQADQLQAEISSLRGQIGSLQKDVAYENETEVAMVDPSGVSATGTIEGKLSFPSEMMPADMEVCAVNRTSQQESCTKEKTPAGYSLKVPAGSYHVFARSKSFNPNYKAYYSEFVTCGLKAGCLSHAPIEVKVDAAKVTTGVDPQDWYNVAN